MPPPTVIVASPQQQLPLSSTGNGTSPLAGIVSVPAAAAATAAIYHAASAAQATAPADAATAAAAAIDPVVADAAADTAAVLSSENGVQPVHAAAPRLQSLLGYSLAANPPWRRRKGRRRHRRHRRAGHLTLSQRPDSDAAVSTTATASLPPPPPAADSNTCAIDVACIIQALLVAAVSAGVLDSPQSSVQPLLGRRGFVDLAHAAGVRNALSYAQCGAPVRAKDLIQVVEHLRQMFRAGNPAAVDALFARLAVHISSTDPKAGCHHAMLLLDELPVDARAAGNSALADSAATTYTTTSSTPVRGIQVAIAAQPGWEHLLLGADPRAEVGCTIRWEVADKARLVLAALLLGEARDSSVAVALAASGCMGRRKCHCY